MPVQLALPEEVAMNRFLNVSPALGTFGFVTFLVALPVVGLLLGIVVLALLSAIF